MLNPQQSAAVEHCEGPLLVLAGAGSGKTRVIVEKIARLISSGRYPARRIAAITFTNKSAKEMRERVAQRIRGDAAEGLTVCTFHALGLRILQIEHERAGLRRGFSVFDTDDCLGQFRDLLPGAKPDVVQAMQQLEVQFLCLNKFWFYLLWFMVFLTMSRKCPACPTPRTTAMPCASA